MRSETIAAIAQRIAQSANGRQRTRTAVLSGSSRIAEDDKTRSAAFDARVARALGVSEAIHETNDFQPAAFLPNGATARRAVARVLVQMPNESGAGSGFL